MGRLARARAAKTWFCIIVVSPTSRGSWKAYGVIRAALRRVRARLARRARPNDSTPQSICTFARIRVGPWAVLACALQQLAKTMPTRSTRKS